jgi:quercetin dioxygenase-like cupin family protein
MIKIEITSDDWIEAAGYRKNVLTSRQQSLEADSLVQVVEIPAGKRVADHYHRQTIEFYHVLSGTCEFTVNEQRIELSRDDMLLVEPGDRHPAHKRRPDDFRLLVFKTNYVRNDTVWLDEDHLK